MPRRIFISFAIALLLIIVLAACQPIPPLPNGTEVLLPTVTPTSGEVLLPTVTPALGEILLPTVTPTPAEVLLPTVTPVPDALVNQAE